MNIKVVRFNKFRLLSNILKILKVNKYICQEEPWIIHIFIIMNKLIKAIVLKITFIKAIILFASDLYIVSLLSKWEFLCDS